MKYPPLRFPQFSRAWAIDKLESVADVKGGKRIPKGHSLTEINTGHPYITVSDMSHGTVNLTNIKYVPLPAIDAIKNYKINSSDIYISVAGTLGLIGVVPPELENANLTENANKLTNLRCEQSYLLQYLQSNKLANLINSVKTANAQPKLAIYAIKAFTIGIPSLPEQQKIAAFLSAVDKKIQQLQRKQELLEQYKKGVMQKIFSQEIRFKNEDGNDYPEWEEKRLGDMLSLVVDNRGKTPPISEKGIPLIEINAVGNREIQYNRISKHVSKEVYDNWFRKYLCPGDVLFSTVGATALCSIYNGQILSAIAQNLVGLRFATENQSFMYYTLSEARNNHKFKRIEMGAVQPSVKVSQMININFLVPCLEEQNKISILLSVVDNNIKLISAEVEQLGIFKKGLLQQMFV